MTHSAQQRGSVFSFFTIVALSSALMVWLFWHFPLITAIVTLLVLGAFELSARVSELIEAEGRSEFEPRAN
jgi:hypothetical protein